MVTFWLFTRLNPCIRRFSHSLHATVRHAAEYKGMILMVLLSVYTWTSGPRKSIKKCEQPSTTWWRSAACARPICFREIISLFSEGSGVSKLRAVHHLNMQSHSVIDFESTSINQLVINNHIHQPFASSSRECLREVRKRWWEALNTSIVILPFPARAEISQRA